MATVRLSGYVVQSAKGIPHELKDLRPFELGNTNINFKRPEGEILEPETGRVMTPGAIEFQTQITPAELAQVCDPEEIYKPDLRLVARFRVVYDPEIQRGLKTSDGGKHAEFLRPKQIEEMKHDILEGRFDCPPLMWNLRADETTWVYVREDHTLRIYEGVATRPDSNHRHHAIIRVHEMYRKWLRDTGGMQFENYNPRAQYGLTIYTDSQPQESHRFYVYNFKGWRVPTSTAHYVESKSENPTLYSRLAREVMEGSGVLMGNVELLTNTMSKNAAKMVTFGTLVDALKTAFPGLTEDDYDEVKTFAMRFVEQLHKVRPHEIAVLSLAKRQHVREHSVADQAVLWHGYMRVAGQLRGVDGWEEALQALAKPTNYKGYVGDPLARANPAWVERGVLVPGKKEGTYKVNNTRESREAAFEYLNGLVQSELRGQVAAPVAPAAAAR